MRRGVALCTGRGKSRIETQQIGTVIGRQRRWRFQKPPAQVLYTQRFPQTFDALTALAKKFFIWDLMEQRTSCPPSCGGLRVGRDMLLPIPFCLNMGSPRRFPFGGTSCVSPSCPVLAYLKASTERHSTGSVGAPRAALVARGGRQRQRLAAADDRHIPLKT